MAFSTLSLLSSLNSSSLTIVSSNAFVSSGSGETLRDGPLRRRSLACHDDRTRLFGTTKPRSPKPSRSLRQRLRRARAESFRGSLADFPESGRMVPEVGSRRIREVIFGAYRVIYSTRTQVDILTVRRSSQLLRMSELDDGET